MSTLASIAGYFPPNTSLWATLDQVGLLGQTIHCRRPFYP